MNYNTYLSDTEGEETLGGGYTSASESIMTGGDLDSDFEMEGGYNSDELNEQVGGLRGVKIAPVVPGMDGAQSPRSASPVPEEQVSSEEALENTRHASPVHAAQEFQGSETGQEYEERIPDEMQKAAVAAHAHNQKMTIPDAQQPGKDGDGYESDRTTSLSDDSSEGDKNKRSIGNYNNYFETDENGQDRFMDKVSEIMKPLNDSDKDFINKKIGILENNDEDPKTEEDKFRFKVKILAFIDGKLHEKTGANISVVKNTGEGEHTTYEVKDIKLR